MSLDPDFFHYGPNLPHLDKPDLMHFVTFRLHDSLPAVVLLQIAQELEEVPLEERQKEEYKKWNIGSIRAGVVVYLNK